MIIVTLTEESGKEQTGTFYGSDKQIIENINYLNSIREKQIVKVNIVRTGKDTGVIGCKKRNIEYEFKYDEKKKCYAY